MPGLDDSAALIKLHRRFVELVNKTIYCRRTLIDEVLLHSVSLEKLRAAAWTAIRRSACPSDLRNDVMQEATLAVLQSFRHRPPAYADQGADAFGRWLWLLWYRAARRAIGRVQRERATSIEELCLANIDLPSGNSRSVAVLRQSQWEEVLFLISRIDDAQVRLVLSDWAAGLTGAESARLRGLSQFTISRLRKQGAAYLRRKLHPGGGPRD